MTLLTDTARAKINLTLRVLGRRPDGYHDLDSIVVFADCADRLTLAPGPDLALSVTGPAAAACGAGEDNLVLRAGRDLAARIPGLTLGRFTLDKHLPVAAGIGGGSADAAAALRLLALANGILRDDPRLIAAARATGADVPVCLDSEACVMAGIGEHLTPLALPAMACVLVNPGVAVSTAQVFAALHLRAGQLRAGVSEILEAVMLPKPGAPAEQWIEQLTHGTNDLEGPAQRLQPVIGEVLTALRAAAGARFARMSGSGATCFAVFAHQDEAAAAAQAIRRDHPAWWVHAGTLS